MLVDRIGVVGIEGVHTFLDVVFLGAVLQRQTKERFVGLERKLVHRVDRRQIVEDEEEHGTAQRTRLVRTRRRIDLSRRRFRHLKTTRAAISLDPIDVTSSPPAARR